MKCTDNTKRTSENRKKRNRRAICMSVILAILCIAAAYIYYVRIDSKPEYLAAEYESSQYAHTLYRADALFAEDLCVAAQDVSLEGMQDVPGLDASGFHEGALFDINGKKVDYASRMHEKLYPASTTKILTALVAIKNGNLDDMVTVSERASASSFAVDEQTCGIQTGDQLTLRDLLYGLMLFSGNDNAVAIAEHIAGSVEAFADMMNTQAAELLATKSHFVNPNGLHNEDHYTTAYDLYLIFNECIKYQEFIDMIQTTSYTAHITGADGSTRDLVVEPTNYYSRGATALPEGVTVIGGKTGTTNEAGNCLILLDESSDGSPYISVIMGASSKELLYTNMTALIETIPGN